MKKTIFILAIMMLTINVMSVAAFAHGGHRMGYGAGLQARYEICAVDDCDIVGPHQHDGAWYCSQTGWQGNYEICIVDGCTQLGLHEHNGTYYYCADHGTGRGCGRGAKQ